MTCCGALPDDLTVNTGRDERFPEAAQALQALGFDRDVDLWKCKTCGTLYQWSDHPQFYGSGNLDEEQLKRLKPDEAILVERLLQGGEGQEVNTIYAAASAQLSEKLVSVLLGQLRKTRPDQLERLIPQFVERLLRTDDHGMYSWLQGSIYNSRPRAELIAGLLRRGAPLQGKAKYLLELCEAK